MDLVALKQQFEKSKNLEALNQQLKKFLAQQGFSTFTFTYYSSVPGNRNKVKYDFVTDNIRAWHEYYLSQRFEEVDSDLQKARQAVMPIYWQLEQQVETAKTKREKQLREESISIDVVKGLSIPIHGPGDDFAILLLQQRRHEKALNDYQQKELQWLALGYLYYEFVRKLLVHQTPKQLETDLSPRELQCLHFVSQGCSVEEIAARLKITARTVNFHLQNINKKLGTRNKYQSVKEAQAKGLLIM